MSRFRFAVIGCGRMGLAHSRRLAGDDRASIAGFYDADIAAAEQLRDSFATEATVCHSLDELLQSVDADAAVIGTPTSSHRNQIFACAERGWHVLTEKPLADTRDRIVELIDLANSSPQHFMVGYQRRCWTLYRRLLKEVQSGHHGPIRAVTGVSCEYWQQTIGDTWRDDPMINSGGYLGDAGSHKLDILFFVTGLRLQTLTAATSGNCGSRVPIVSSVIGSLDGDVPLTLTFTGHTNSFHEELFIHCEHADLIVRDYRLWIGRENAVEEIELPANESGRESVRNPVSEFLGLLEGGENIAPFECALPVFDFTAEILGTS